jgi:hypothetical protein
MLFVPMLFVPVLVGPVLVGPMLAFCPTHLLVGQTVIGQAVKPQTVKPQTFTARAERPGGPALMPRLLPCGWKVDSGAEATERHPEWPRRILPDTALADAGRRSGPGVAASAPASAPAFAAAFAAAGAAASRNCTAPLSYPVVRAFRTVTMLSTVPAIAPAIAPSAADSTPGSPVSPPGSAPTFREDRVSTITLRVTALEDGSVGRIIRCRSSYGGAILLGQVLDASTVRQTGMEKIAW